MRRSAKSRVGAAVGAVVLSAIISTGVTVSPAEAAGGVSVSGRVTGEAVSGPDVGISTIYVQLHSLTAAGDSILPAAYTDSSGAYTITGVAAGTYRVSFSRTMALSPQLHESSWWGGTPFETQADLLVVGSTDLVGIDARLSRGGSISGTITLGAGVSEASITVHLINPDTGLPERTAVAHRTAVAGPYTVPGLSPGEYIVRFREVFSSLGASTEYWPGATYLADAQTVTVADHQQVTGIDGSVTAVGADLFRFAGATRFDVAESISQVGWDPATTDAVFIVNGLNYPDALSAGPAAARVGAPILLVTPQTLPEQTRRELERLTLTDIFVVGGPASVSEAVVTQMSAYGTVTRISGADRFEASVNVAEYFWSGDAGNRTAYLATGNNFPDALAAGPAAAAQGAPIILQNGRLLELTSETETRIGDLGYSRMIVAGGPASFTAELEASLLAIPGVIEAHRHSGANRYEAAETVNRLTFRLADTVFLATGANFPDALTGAALAARWGAPLLLVQQNCIPQSVIDQIQFLGPKDVILLGGPNSLGAGVESFVPCPA